MSKAKYDKYDAPLEPQEEAYIREFSTFVEINKTQVLVTAYFACVDAIRFKDSLIPEVLILAGFENIEDAHDFCEKWNLAGTPYGTWVLDPQKITRIVNNAVRIYRRNKDRGK